MKRVIIPLVLLLLVSCSTVDNDTKEVITTKNLVFQTDQSSYTAEVLENFPPAFYGFTLIARFENKTNQTLYLNRCDVDSSHPRYVFKLHLTENPQSPAHNIIFACAGHNNPITVKSGSVRIDTLDVRSPQMWDHATKEPIGIFEGTFQLVYDVWTCKTGDRCDLPDSLSTSNEFEVQLAD
ncbi:hypothetical protein [Rhodohalobacter sp. 614A]|uniref:hypothetical protein n=1 Tax=Rhodohalobacter sp. 614A TaxID=2908649 RepID=UPI001F31A006|nr:hypothetical protein [Rhodohalobacter sp. 614A]